MAYEKILKINGFIPPAPDEGGITIGVEKIWSENTGRSASGRMVGDIKAIKTVLDISWSKMSAADVSALDAAVNDIYSPFFSVEYYDQSGSKQNKTFYAAPNSYVQKKYSLNGIEYSDISIQLIEQ